MAGYELNAEQARANRAVAEQLMQLLTADPTNAPLAQWTEISALNASVAFDKP